MVDDVDGDEGEDPVCDCVEAGGKVVHGPEDRVPVDTGAVGVVGGRGQAAGEEDDEGEDGGVESVEDDGGFDGPLLPAWVDDAEEEVAQSDLDEDLVDEVGDGRGE